jgi:hypothetical protein
MARSQMWCETAGIAPNYKKEGLCPACRKCYQVRDRGGPVTAIGFYDRYYRSDKVRQHHCQTIVSFYILPLIYHFAHSNIIILLLLLNLTLSRHYPAIVCPSIIDPINKIAVNMPISISVGYMYSFFHDLFLLISLYVRRPLRDMAMP